jgi:hypothetical protein
MPEDPNELVPDTARKEPFLGLGRALGRGIPRAGKLRAWEGDPTALSGHNFNTHFLRPNLSSDNSILEHDPFPQQISPTFFDDTGLQVKSGGQRHPLFLYSDEQDIEFLPDHMHEGKVVVPDLKDETVWKRNAAGLKPGPQVVATGLNADTGESLPLIIAYDGTAINVGRIVADTSWHHYFNVNLEGLLFPAPVGSPADQIGQFYANLGIWLCPIKKRQEMADAMISWLASQPVVLEVYGPVSTDELPALLGTGDAALALLKRVASPCEIHELVQMKVPRKRLQKVETLFLPEESAFSSALPSKQLLLGYLVNRSLQDKQTEKSIPKPVDAAEEAFRRQQDEILRVLKDAEKTFS